MAQWSRGKILALGVSNCKGSRVRIPVEPFLARFHSCARVQRVQSFFPHRIDQKLAGQESVFYQRKVVADCTEAGRKSKDSCIHVPVSPLRARSHSDPLIIRIVIRLCNSLINPL